MRRLILKQVKLLPSLSPSHSHSHSQFNTNPFFSHSFHSTLSHSFFPTTFQPPSYTYTQNDHLCVSQILELLRSTKASSFTSHNNALDFVVNSGITSPDGDNICLAIWELKDDWELGLLGFQMMAKLGGVTDKMLGVIVYVLGTHHKFDVAWSLIRDSHRLVDTRPAMLSIIDRYAAANNHEKAVKTFHFMEKLTLQPDQNAFYSVISALCRYGNVEEAEDFMLNNKKLYPLETEGFNIILHGWCVISVDVVEAKRVWREMANYCITPNAMSYSHMISCFSKVGNLFDSLRLYDEMKKRGWTPGLDVYNSLIYVMAGENCLSEALKIIEKIKEMGLQPDSRSYNCLICPLCEAGKFDEATNLISIMTQEGYQPTIETYHALLNGANLQGTFGILNQMKIDKVGPDNDTFLLIFDRFFKLKEPENVLKVWVEMRDFGVLREPRHYNSLICGLANCGCLIKAKELHTEMLSNGYVDDPKLRKLLEEPVQGIRCGRVESINFVRRVTKSNCISSHRERIKHGAKSSGRKQAKT